MGMLLYDVDFFVLAGEHTLVKSVVHSKVGQLSAFTQKRATCVGCKALLPKDREGNALLVRYQCTTTSDCARITFFAILI